VLGKLTWQAIPFDQPIPLAAGAFVVLLICSVLIWVWAKATSRIFGANGSRASITSVSASCTASLGS